MAKTTTYKTYDCAIEYSQVFERNMDHGGDDNDAAITIKSKGGMTKLIMIVDEELKDQMIKDGIPAVSLGHDQFKGPDEDGNYRYQAKRYWLTAFDEYTGTVDEETKESLINHGVEAWRFEESKGSFVFTGGNLTYLSKKVNLDDVELVPTGNKAIAGPPNVVDYAASLEEGKAIQWDHSVNIGNGSKAKVKLSIYKNGNKRIIKLEGLGVTELVPYESSGDGIRI